jgi:hypothetical protein
MRQSRTAPAAYAAGYNRAPYVNGGKEGTSSRLGGGTPTRENHQMLDSKWTLIYESGNQRRSAPTTGQ